MKRSILSLSLLFLTLFTYGQVNYCDSIEISITSQTATSVEFSSTIPTLNMLASISYDWSLTDESGIVIGTDSTLPGTYPGSSYFQEIKLLSEYGLSNWEILAGATSYNAQLFLKEPDFGTIEKGKRADILLLSENPLIHLETIENPEKIIAGGKIIERKD